MRAWMLVLAVIALSGGCEQINTPSRQSSGDSFNEDATLKKVMDRQSPDYSERVRKGEIVDD